MRDMDHQSIPLLSIFGSSWRLGHEEHAGHEWSPMVPKPIISPTKRWAKEPGVMSRQHETGKLARHHVPNVYLNPEPSGCLQPKVPSQYINELWFPKSLWLILLHPNHPITVDAKLMLKNVGLPHSHRQAVKAVKAVKAHGADSLPSFPWQLLGTPGGS